MIRKFLVLAVDDNSNNLFTLRTILEKLPNLEIVEAQSGEEALRLSTERNFHLILMDVQMPSMSGYETAEILKLTERTRDIPIVFLTAFFKSEEFVSYGYAIGAIDYLVKPLDDNILLNRVSHYQKLREREQVLEDTLIELRNMRSNLLQTEKLSALGPIVAGVSHELNTPLGNLKMAATTMRERIIKMTRIFEQGKLSRDLVAEYIQDTNDLMEISTRSVERALFLVNNFKQMSVDTISENRIDLDLRTLVESAVSSFRSGLNNTPWKIYVDIPDNIKMTSYPTLIEQIINNVLTNSIRHGFQGRDQGDIKISGRIENVVREPGLPKLKQLVLTVADNGRGIKPENLGRVFDPFFTTRLGQGGSGIGLNICHRIATTLLGGTITLDSILESGTFVTLTIPCEAPETI